MGGPNHHPPGPWTRQPSPRRAAWYPSPDHTQVSIDWLLANLRNPRNALRLPRAGADAPVVAVPDYEIVLSIARGSNGKLLHVRCRCMAGTVRAPAQRFYGYDTLGQAGSLDEARRLWREHVSRGTSR